MGEAPTESAQEVEVFEPGEFLAERHYYPRTLNAQIHPQVRRLLNELADRSKPIGAICIAPTMVVRALSHRSPRVTIGNDAGTAAAIESMGGGHVNCTVADICVDEKNRIVTTPAYMLGPGIKDVAAGIEKLVGKVLSLC